MYDLNKIIIIADYYLEDKEGLETVVMKTLGMKVTDLLYINDKGSMITYEEDRKDIVDQLYSDMYDDDLNVVISEAYNGEDAHKQIATFVDDVWDPDSLLYYYDPSEENFDFLVDELRQYNGNIYLDEYHNIFVEGKEIKKDLLEIMKEQGLAIENMLKDSAISYIYFLHALVEKIINK